MTERKIKIPTKEERRIEQIESRLLSPSEIYERLDKINTHLEQLKHYKLDQLNELCNKAIVRGFVYTIENKEYLFSASVEAQGNFQGTDALFKEGLIQEVYWSVTNTSTDIVERVRLDNELFNQVKIQLFNHINTQISKFRDFLQPLVLEASTNSEVDAIDW